MIPANGAKSACVKTSCVKSSRVTSKVHSLPDASPVRAARFRNIFRLSAVVLSAASLAACAQSTAVRHSASLPHERTASFTDWHVASERKHTLVARRHDAPSTQIASRGIASFYTEGQRTASGERFDTNDLTAAHPTLPFGTRLRVTNLSTGRSVTVRVNDRGPYVPGRIVDVSHSAANALGMAGSGIAKVKLDVVQ